ncbi:hypothetical protein F4859DRAFT_512008 [Xylaria cf. heliscus]|nr:hypothetical protein F4859DRAFT_512008 [Xylaria cf. heliscus]
MSDTSSSTEILADVEWPFSQEPIKLRDLEDQPILLSVASDDDLEAITDFTADYYLKVDQLSCLVPSEYLEKKRPLIKERYRTSFQAIMDSCIPDKMTGVVLKIEHKDVIKGVMAVHMFEDDDDDAWTETEGLQKNSDRYSWIFPTTAYLDMLSNFMRHGHSGSRTILNVPHLIASLDGRYTGLCLTTFTTLLETIARQCQYSVVINSHEGTCHSLLRTYITYNNEFTQIKWVTKGAMVVMEYAPGYRVYVKVTMPLSDESQQLYLDQAVWEAFNEFGSPLQSPETPHRDLSPMPPLEIDFGSPSSNPR